MRQIAIPIMKMSVLRAALFVFPLVSCAASGSATVPKNGTAEASAEVKGPGEVKASPSGMAQGSSSSCSESVEDTPKPALTFSDFAQFLEARGLSYRISRERNNLELFDVTFEGKTYRLRVARLASPALAGRHLHLALLEHGNGYWGVHRGNLAVLGPQSPLDGALSFAKDSGLFCWGVFTASGRDDTFVVPGGHFEL